MEQLINAWPIIIALAGAGVIAGTLAGLLGIGGGLIIVPTLYFLLQIFDVSADSAMSIATATSLATIVPTSLSSIRAHLANGNVDIQLLKFWGVIILLSAVLGSLIAVNISGATLSLVFAAIVIYSSFKMLLGKGNNPFFKTMPSKWIQTLMATAVGGFSVMIGIGGATIGVPLLSSCNIAAHRAVGTAAAFGLFIALPGVITLLLVGQTPFDAPIGTWRLINIPAFVIIVPLTMLFAPLGAKLGTKLNAQQLRKVFALFLLFTGARMLLKTSGIL